MATIVQRGFLFCPHVYLQRAKGISFLYACVPSCIFSTLKTCVSNSAFIFGKHCPYAAATRSFFFVVQRIRAAAQQNHIFIAFTIFLCVACLLASFFCAQCSGLHTHVVDALALIALASSCDACAGDTSAIMSFDFLLFVYVESLYTRYQEK